MWIATLRGNATEGASAPGNGILGHDASETLRFRNGLRQNPLDLADALEPLIFAQGGLILDSCESGQVIDQSRFRGPLNRRRMVRKIESSSR